MHLFIIDVEQSLEQYNTILKIHFVLSQRNIQNQDITFVNSLLIIMLIYMVAKQISWIDQTKFFLKVCLYLYI